MALIRNSIREPQADGSTRNKISAGVSIIRGRNKYTQGRWAPKKFFQKICRKLSHSAEKDPIPYLNTCITYLNTLTPYLNTCINHLNTLTRLSALGSIS